MYGVQCLQATECTGLGFFLQSAAGEKECVETCASGRADASLRCVEACPGFFVESGGQVRCVSECPEELSFHEETGKCVAACAQRAGADRGCVEASKGVNFIAIVAAVVGVELVAGIVAGVVCCKRRKQAWRARSAKGAQKDVRSLKTLVPALEIAPQGAPAKLAATPRPVSGKLLKMAASSGIVDAQSVLEVPELGGELATSVKLPADRGRASPRPQLTQET